MSGVSAIIVSITAFGTVPAQTMVLRAGVAAGDRIYVTGTIGDAALGLKFRLDAAQDVVWTHCVSQADAAYLAGRYLLPRPRLGLRAALRAHAHAAMDISDGFVGDLTKILGLTGMTDEVTTADVSLSETARKILPKTPSLLETILTGGDDYEILSPCRPPKAPPSKPMPLPLGSRCARSARPSQAPRRQCSRMRRGGVWSSRGLPSSNF